MPLQIFPLLKKPKIFHFSNQNGSNQKKNITEAVFAKKADHRQIYCKVKKEEKLREKYEVELVGVCVNFSSLPPGPLLLPFYL